jgi:1,4-dihydroxy-2-naphthoate octaprenyltransferase
LPAFIALPVAIAMIYYFMREPRGRGFNRILVRTVLTQLFFGMLLALGLVL